MIILNNVEAAVDLMEKRSSNYSGPSGFTYFPNVRIKGVTMIHVA